MARSDRLRQSCSLPVGRARRSRRCPRSAWTIRARPPSLPGRALSRRPGRSHVGDADRGLGTLRAVTRRPPDHDLVLVVDFGAQYAQLIARRVREARVYSEIVPHSMPVAEMLARRPEGDHPSRRPVLGLRRGRARHRRRGLHGGGPRLRHVLRLPADGPGRSAARSPTPAPASTAAPRSTSPRRGTLLADLPVDPQRLDVARRLGRRGARRASPSSPPPTGTPVAAFEDTGRGLAGVQWHPEVLHSEHGQQVLEHFLHEIAGCRQTWTMVNIVEEQVERIREQVGERGRAICALSGGVDSAVAAAIVQRAIGDRLTCVYVDHGMMRKGETEQVEPRLRGRSSTPSTSSTPPTSSSARWPGSTTPRRSARSSAASSSGPSRPPRSRVFGALADEDRGDTAYLVQGTLYPDVVESGGGAGTSNIKSHHNVGGLPDDLAVRADRAAAHPVQGRGARRRRAARPARRRWCGASPFPGPGLGIRIIGEVTRERLDLLREADAIAREELTRAGLDRDIWQMPGRAARRRPLGRRPGRRPHLRPPGRAAPGHLRGRDDRRLGAPALRRAGAHLDPDHQRGRRDQPGHPRHHRPSPRAPSSGSEDGPRDPPLGPLGRRPGGRRRRVGLAARRARLGGRRRAPGWPTTAPTSSWSARPTRSTSRTTGCARASTTWPSPSRTARLLDRIRAESSAHGWHELFADRYPHAGGDDHTALYLENSEGFEVELVVGD